MEELKDSQLLCSVQKLNYLLCYFQPASSSPSAGSSTAAGGEDTTDYSANTGTIGRQGLSAMLPGAEDMMSEMARKLQERRRKADSGASTGVSNNLILILHRILS